MIHRDDHHINAIAEHSTLPSKDIFGFMVTSSQQSYPLYIPPDQIQGAIIVPGDWIQFHMEKDTPIPLDPSAPTPCAVVDHHFTLKECLNMHFLAPRACMLHLARTFEILAPKVSHLKEWDSDSFDRMARKFSSSEVFAARFILKVWNCHTKWKCGEFNAVDAVSSWSHHDRAAFCNWVMDPWWP